MKKIYLIISLVVIVPVIIYFLLNKPDQKYDLTKVESDRGLFYLNTAPDVKYVGSKTCIPCHKSTHSNFSHAEMGKSMEVLNDNNIIEDYSNSQPVYDERVNYYYEMIKTDSGFYQREYRLDNQGNVYHERFMRAVFTIGSGTNLRMYFHDENGMFYQLPLTWYTNKNKWDLSPGYRNNANIRFSRFATRKCITCHNAYLTESVNAVDRYSKPYIYGIDCERCHGPGELHVKEMNEEINNIPANARTIVNPRKLSTERQLSVCMQCHSQGKAWAMQNEDGWFSFKPGQLLSSNRSIYYPIITNKHAIEVGESPFRLKLSRCFTESSGKMTCITCHDPHQSIKKFTMQHYNDKCITCHVVNSLPVKESGNSHKQNDNCISCHMNQTGKDNTLHGVPLTDHWIRKDAYRDKIDWTPLLTPPQSQPPIQLVADIDADDSRKDTRKGIAYIEYYKEYDTRNIYLDSALLYLNKGFEKEKNYAAAYFYAGEAYFLYGKYNEALDAYKKAVQYKNDYHEAFYKTGRIYKFSNNPLLAAEAYRNALKYKPKEPSYIEGLANAYLDLKKYDESVKLFEEAVQIDKQNPYTFYSLGILYALRLKQPQKALSCFIQAATLDPDINDVYLNLGNTYAMLENYPEAELAFLNELTVRPNSVSAKINLAQLYKMFGKKADANKLLREVLTIEPGNQLAKSLLLIK